MALTTDQVQVQISQKKDGTYIVMARTPVNRLDTNHEISGQTCYSMSEAFAVATSFFLANTKKLATEVPLPKNFNALKEEMIAQ